MLLDHGQKNIDAFVGSQARIVLKLRFVCGIKTAKYASLLFHTAL